MPSCQRLLFLHLLFRCWVCCWVALCCYDSGLDYFLSLGNQRPLYCHRWPSQDGVPHGGIPLTTSLIWGGLIWSLGLFYQVKHRGPPRLGIPDVAEPGLLTLSTNAVCVHLHGPCQTRAHRVEDIRSSQGQGSRKERFCLLLQPAWTDWLARMMSVIQPCRCT